ncbi:FecR domain-containing protein [Candidatus Neomarinimicrobiota bacterium]
MSDLQAQGKQLFGRVTFPLGTVQVKITSNPDWEKVTLNREVFVGDQIKTLEKSRCEITLNGGGKMRIGEKTEMELTQASVTPLKKDFAANVSQGQVWVAAKAAFGESKSVAVRAPTAVAAIRGTKYRTVADTEESSVLVYEGKVDVVWAQAVEDSRQGDSGEGGAPTPIRIGPPQEVAPPEEVPGPYEVTLEDWITLVEGMQINVRRDGKYNMFEFDSATDDELEFVRWNKDLDAEQGE